MDLKKDVSIKSTFYKRLIEHIFISEIIQESLFKFEKYVEVLRSEIDTSGYDIVLECNGYIRHIQLKSSIRGASKTKISANIALCEKPSGCIILVDWDIENHSRISFNYLFFGDKPGRPLFNIQNNKIGKHTKPNSEGIKTERPSIREIKLNQFSKINNIEDLCIALFGLERPIN